MENEQFPYFIRFDNGNQETYTGDGRMHPYGSSVLTPLGVQAVQTKDGLLRWVCRDNATGEFYVSRGRYRDKKHCEDAVVDAVPVIAIPGS